MVTDDERIAGAVADFGGEVLMTGSHHRSGTERIAEAVDALGLDASEVIVNLQGDEPLMPPDLIRQVAEDMERFPTADLATLATRIDTAAELFDPHAVKVVMDKEGFALYFSRAVIPWDREAFAVTTKELPPAAEHYRHLGLYAYRAGFLSRYVEMPSCSIESMEALEQLRVLWHGGRIHVAEAIAEPGPGVDTAADLNRVRELFEV